MLHVVTPDEMRLLEERAIAAGVAQKDLMDRAGACVAEVILSQLKVGQHVLFLCGKGNNGGDGYVAARVLLERGVSVSVWQMASSTVSPLLTLQQDLFVESGGVVTLFTDQEIPKDCLIVDALFGIGFQGKIEGQYLDAITKINNSGCYVLSIDIPSGLHGATGEVLSTCVKASMVVAIEFLKLGFFLQEGWNVCGTIEVVHIGLAFFITDTKITYLEQRDVSILLPPMKRNQHKYQAGHVVGVAGSLNMMGAAFLAASATLKSGCGICHLLYPKSAVSEVARCPLEVISVPYEGVETITTWIMRAAACFIGPGLGAMSDEVMLPVIKNLKMKNVLDADALNWLARNRQVLDTHLFSHTIMTPHIQEMKRLLGSEEKGPITRDFLFACASFAERLKTHLVLKGGPTFLFFPDGKMLVMPFGDPGMATAGSGDVLTGMIASFLAQGSSCIEAMILGTALHGLSGMLAAKQETSYCVTASSIIEHLPQAFSCVCTQEQIGQ